MRLSSLDVNRLSGTLPTELGKLNPALPREFCALTTTQCLTSWDCGRYNTTNAFSCPVPPLTPNCAANLNITCSPPSAPPLPLPPPAEPTPASQVRALQVLYAAAGGVGWSTKTNWMNGDPCVGGSIWYEETYGTGGSSWSGVACSGGNVYSLDLGWNNMSGTLPSELGLLTAIKYLCVLSAHSLPTVLKRVLLAMTHAARALTPTRAARSQRCLW